MDILNDSLPGWSRRKYLKDTIELIQEEKRFLKHELTKIFGDQMKIFPSEANFLLLKTQIPLYRLLLERGILIRNCANYTGLGQDFYRIAVKGHPENVQLIEALLDIKKKGEENVMETLNMFFRERLKTKFCHHRGRTKGAWYRASAGTGAGDKARDPYKCGF